MSVAKPRNRLVFFRVSEEEFQKLASICESGEAARSISELARLAVHRFMVDNNGDEQTVFHKLQHLDKRMDDLHEVLCQLVEIVTSTNAAPRSKIRGDGSAETANG